jgi:hypothetical protein
MLIGLLMIYQGNAIIRHLQDDIRQYKAKLKSKNEVTLAVRMTI